jgi:hypothetical protein
MFRIELTPEAIEDLESLRTFDQRCLITAMEAQLVHEPGGETRNRKRLRPNNLAEWELRIEAFVQAPPDVVHLLDQARNEDLIVRLADGSEFILVAIDDFEQEVARTRNNPKVMALLQARARQTATVPLNEVKTRLGL